MKLFLILTLLLISTLLHANEVCKVVSYAHVVKLNKVLDDSIVKETNCSQEVINTYIDFISGATGELTSKHLIQIFKSEYNLNISLEPEKIKIESIDEVLSSLIQLPKNLILKKVSGLYSKATLTLSSTDRIQVQCKDCETAGEKNIKLIINNSPIWFSAEILSKRKGLVSNTELSPFSKNLSKEMFTYTSIFDDGNGHLFQDIDHLQFYKVNKTVKKGDILKVTDISPLVLVKPGQKIKVILKGKNVALKSSAISRQQGKIGDYIEVYNQKTSKKINAQVIDFNTVMVEL